MASTAVRPTKGFLKSTAGGSRRLLLGQVQETAVHPWNVHHCALHARSNPRKELLYVTADVGRPRWTCIAVLTMIWVGWTDFWVGILAMGYDVRAGTLTAMISFKSR